VLKAIPSLIPRKKAEEYDIFLKNKGESYHIPAADASRIYNLVNQFLTLFPIFVKTVRV
jgi:hypothetical protein